MGSYGVTREFLAGERGRERRHRAHNRVGPGQFRGQEAIFAGNSAYMFGKRVTFFVKLACYGGKMLFCSAVGPFPHGKKV